MQKLIYLLIPLLIWSCSTTKGRTSNVKESKSISSSFNYNQFKIRKGQLGTVKIGMSIQSAEKHLTNLKRVVGKAEDLGYDGASPAYLYYDKNDVVLCLIPKLNSNKIQIIIVASSKFKVRDGLNPQVSANDILKKYPNSKVQYNAMNDWEEIIVEKYNINYIFTTGNKKVGSYRKDKTSAIINGQLKSAWISIR